VFRTVKRLVSTLETNSFKRENTLFQAVKPKVSPVETSIYIPVYVYMQACSFQTVIDE